MLFSSFAVSFYTWPPVGGQPAQLLTPQAEKLFHNALDWALDAPPLTAEARGAVRSSAGGLMPSTVKVVQTGRVFSGRAGDGTFLVPLQPGTWTLEVSAFGHATKTIPVTVGVGEVRQLDVVLQADDVGAVAGRVADEVGTPLEGVVLSLEGTPLGATTTTNGRYRIDGVPAGDYTLVVRKTGFGLQRLDVTVPAGATTTVDVAMAVSRAVAVAGDHLNSITTLLTENGYAVSQWSWADIQNHVGDLEDVELVVLNGASSAPTSAEFTTFVDAANAAGVPLILAGQFNNGSIRVSRTAVGDPVTVTPDPRGRHLLPAGGRAPDLRRLLRRAADRADAPSERRHLEPAVRILRRLQRHDDRCARRGREGRRSRRRRRLSLRHAHDRPRPARQPRRGDLRLSRRALERQRRAHLPERGRVGARRGAGRGLRHRHLRRCTGAGRYCDRGSRRAASARTAADGSYRLGVPDGTHTIRIAATGYEPFERTVAVGENERLGSTRRSSPCRGVPSPAGPWTRIRATRSPAQPWC